ncbi:bifunctional 2-polyprenyl-6-hydroxyphenol methylase/3-demethylubiquinol 3-O-methyltransferase UbiG [Marinilabilia sp.]|uniref:class I SAM-dependent methyltransferase n=1 Tax=Marinilabilia sp. TaxID=2021252 RepID=UPI0025B98F23|nr:class I SAM-dependent methyltransferase [Marinilabilia sp.]
MTEYWESSFLGMRTSWGYEPSDSAILSKNFLLEEKAKEILIPGIGYGRNAKIFSDNGFKVTGIEISKTAIDLARNEMGLDFKIHHGSVTEMPFDENIYDAIFCYALIHLLNYSERKKFIQDCFNQLKPNGYMIFTVVSKKMSLYGNGKRLSKDRFEIAKGLSVFFYDTESAKQEFEKYGLLEISEIDEPIKHIDNEPPIKCLLIKCKRIDQNEGYLTNTTGL